MNVTVETYDVKEPNRNGDWITLHKIPLNEVDNDDTYRFVCQMNGLDIVGCGTEMDHCENKRFSGREGCIPMPISWGCGGGGSPSMMDEMNRFTDWNHIAAVQETGYQKNLSVIIIISVLEK